MIARISAFIGLVAMMPACLPATNTDILDTETPIPSNTPLATETIVWFPPTATHTPFPTPEVTPTVDQRVDIGNVIFDDDFSNNGGWQLGRTQNASATIGANELTLVVSGMRTYMSTTRDDPVLTNFYLEITAQPNLCRDLDEYGLLFRVSSQVDFYRFSLSCDSQIRFERVVDGVVSVRQPWTFSGSVPPGAPSTSRLAVAAIGNEMRFFINDEFQLTVTDPLLNSGRIGVFVRSASDKTLSVNFSNLTVWEINGE
jgi:hypothetical protein